VGVSSVGLASWQAYDYAGRAVSLEVV